MSAPAPLSATAKRLSEQKYSMATSPKKPKKNENYGRSNSITDNNNPTSSGLSAEAIVTNSRVHEILRNSGRPTPQQPVVYLKRETGPRRTEKSVSTADCKTRMDHLVRIPAPELNLTVKLESMGHTHLMSPSRGYVSHSRKHQLPSERVFPTMETSDSKKCSPSGPKSSVASADSVNSNVTDLSEVAQANSTVPSVSENVTVKSNNSLFSDIPPCTSGSSMPSNVPAVRNSTPSFVAQLNNASATLGLLPRQVHSIHSTNSRQPPLPQIDGLTRNNSLPVTSRAAVTVYPRSESEHEVPLELLINGVQGVRFGTYRTLFDEAGEDPMKISSDGIKFLVKPDKEYEAECDKTNNIRRRLTNPSHKPSDQHKYQFNVSMRHVEKIRYHFSRNLSVMFITVSVYCAKKMSEAMGMVWDPAANYKQEEHAFDPRAEQHYFKYVTILIDYNMNKDLEKSFPQYIEKRVEEVRRQEARREDQQNPSPILLQLDYKSANKMLQQVTAPEVQALKKANATMQRKRKATDKTPLPQDLVNHPNRPSTSKYVRGPLTHASPSHPVISLPANVVRTIATSASQLQLMRNAMMRNPGPVPHNVQLVPSSIIPAGTRFFVPQGGSNGPRQMYALGPLPLSSVMTAVPRDGGGHILSRSPLVTVSRKPVAHSLRRTPAGTSEFYVNQLAGNSQSTPINKQAPTIIDVSMDEADSPGENNQNPDGSGRTEGDGATEGENPAGLKRAKSEKTANETMFCYPPAPEKGRLVMTLADRRCLREGEFLNDTIVEFYLGYLVRELIPFEIRDKVHVFNPFFWTKLNQRITVESLAAVKTEPGQAPLSDTERKARARHQQVKSWTKNVDLFEKDFILFPVNEAAHWMLVIVCFPGKVETNYDPKYFLKREEMDRAMGRGKSMEKLSTKKGTDSAGGVKEEKNSVRPEPIVPERKETESEGKDNMKKKEEPTKVEYERHPSIILFDSLSVSIKERYPTVKKIREFLQVEWAQRKPRQPKKSFDAKAMKGSYPKVPQQDNWWDCGVFLLHYAEEFLINTPPVIPTPAGKMVDWFPQEAVNRKRSEIRELIDKFAKDNGFEIPESEDKIEEDPRVQNPLEGLGPERCVGLTSDRLNSGL